MSRGEKQRNRVLSAFQSVVLTLSRQRENNHAGVVSFLNLREYVRSW